LGGSTIKIFRTPGLTQVNWKQNKILMQYDYTKVQCTSIQYFCCCWAVVRLLCTFQLKGGRIVRLTCTYQLVIAEKEADATINTSFYTIFFCCGLIIGHSLFWSFQVWLITSWRVVFMMITSICLLVVFHQLCPRALNWFIS